MKTPNIFERPDNWQKTKWIGALVVGLLSLAFVVTTPLSIAQQAILGVIACILTFYLASRHTRWAKLCLAVMATATTTRYIYWRLTETLYFDTTLEAVLGYTMLFSEIYLWTVLIMSFAQVLQGRNRKPAPLPADTSKWPTVDVYIPTYNEDVDLVAKTVYAAQQMEYPEDKFRVYILDDGRRAEFARLAQETGVGYIIRPDNKHAKAGNLNHAMTKTDGDLIAIFDCDHVPVKSFLQMTVGWFLRDPKLGLVQTPHHFYNKDPFERNLDGGSKLPNEGLLFYGLLQEGNDFWNATFFCGSCAVLRRKALEEIGGVAVETVTEDAHTSLKFQRKGWNTAFLRKPMAAGLATESLAIHIGQRMRWARGMLQIFRTDNPFFGRGLKFMQRVCYANAMMHFMFPLPRLVLLAVPLAFLVFGQQIISASAWELLSYAIPSLIIATVSTTALQGNHRQPFWGEIYEAALAFHLLISTVVTLLNPYGGKFNVTAKGQRADETYLDTSVLTAQIVFFFVMIAAIIYGIVSVIGGSLAGDVAATTIINVVWASISALVLGMAIIVGREKRELRQEPRIQVDMPATVYLGDGRAIPVTATDISLNGAQLKVPPIETPELTEMGIEMINEQERVYVPVTPVAWDKKKARVAFNASTHDEKSAIVRTVLGRTNAWKDWDNNPRGSTGASLAIIGDSVGGFLNWGVSRFFGGKMRAADTAKAMAVATVAVGALSAFFIMTPTADAQSIPFPELEAIDEASTVSLTDEDLFLDMPNNSRALVRTQGVNLTLDKFGVLQPIRLQGRSNTRGVGFTLRSDQVVNSARMSIPIAFSPNLDPRNSQIVVMLNGQTVHAEALNPLNGTTRTLNFDVNPNLFLMDNNLVFRLMARRQGEQVECSTDEAIWAEVSKQATIRLNVDQLSVQPDLANLPMPFFDPRDASELELPFVFLSRPSRSTVEAASIVASYWGVESSYRGANFPVSFYDIPAQNAIAFVTGEDVVHEFGWPTVSGPGIAVVPNPVSPKHRLLLVMGDNGAEMIAAARSLAVGSNLFSGEIASVQTPLISEREPYDAPRWIPTNRPIKLGELVEGTALEGRGMSPGTLSASLRTAPDLFTTNVEKGVPLKVRFRTPGDQWIDTRKSRLDVLVNDSFVESLPLNEDGWVGLLNRRDTNKSLREGTVTVPAHLIYGQTNLQFYFDLQARQEDDCVSVEPGELKTSIDASSEIDLRDLHRFAQMPNLAFFTQSGFPFTRMADLSETAIVISPKFTEADLQALFQMMGSIGDKTGYPAVRLNVVYPTGVEDFPNHDFLVLGTYDDQSLIRAWTDATAFEFVGDTVRIKSRPALERVANVVGNTLTGEEQSDTVQMPAGALPSAIYSFESPLAEDRTVVVLAAKTGSDLIKLAEAATTSEVVSKIQGDFVAVSDESIMAMSIADKYFVGELPPLTFLHWNISRQPLAIPLLLGSSILFLSFGIGFALNRRNSGIDRADREDS